MFAHGSLRARADRRSSAGSWLWGSCTPDRFCQPGPCTGTGEPRLSQRLLTARLKRKARGLLVQLPRASDNLVESCRRRQRCRP